MKAKKGDLEVFEKLVREYCGRGFYEVLSAGEPLETSCFWEENDLTPSLLQRCVIELLHLASQKE